MSGKVLDMRTYVLKKKPVEPTLPTISGTPDEVMKQLLETQMKAIDAGENKK